MVSPITSLITLVIVALVFIFKVHCLEDHFEPLAFPTSVAGPFPTNTNKALPKTIGLEMHIYNYPDCQEKSSDGSRYQLTPDPKGPRGLFMAWKDIPVGQLTPYKIRSYWLSSDLRDGEGIDFFQQRGMDLRKGDGHPGDSNMESCKVLKGTADEKGKTKGCHTVEYVYDCFNVWSGDGPHVRADSKQPPSDRDYGKGIIQWNG